MRTPVEIDTALVGLSNLSYLRGGAAHIGEKTLAAVLHFFPEYGRRGEHMLPRTIRALTGWRKAVPPRSQRPFPFGFWSAICWQIVLRGEDKMAAMTLMMVDTYMRPGEAIGLLRCDLLPPVRGVSAYWTALVKPEDRDERTKTKEADTERNTEEEELQFLTLNGQ